MGMVMTICPKIHFLIDAGLVWLHHERQLCIYWKQVTVIVWCPGKTRPSLNPLKGVKLILRLEYPFRNFSLFNLMVWASPIPCALEVDGCPYHPPLKLLFSLVSLAAPLMSPFLLWRSKRHFKKCLPSNPLLLFLSIIFFFFFPLELILFQSE